MRRPPISELRPVANDQHLLIDRLVVPAGKTHELSLAVMGDRALRLEVAGTLRLVCSVQTTAILCIAGTVTGDGKLECDVSTLLRDGAEIGVVTRFVVSDKASVSVRSIVEEADAYASAKVSHEHHHLLLSREARAHAVPELFIRSEDVQASHAVTVAHVDDVAMAFASARGIGEDEARTMIVDGFLWN